MKEHFVISILHVTLNEVILEVARSCNNVTLNFAHGFNFGMEGFESKAPCKKINKLKFRSTLFNHFDAPEQTDRQTKRVKLNSKRKKN